MLRKQTKNRKRKINYSLENNVQASYVEEKHVFNNNSDILKF